MVVSLISLSMAGRVSAAPGVSERSPTLNRTDAANPGHLVVTANVSGGSLSRTASFESFWSAFA